MAEVVDLALSKDDLHSLVVQASIVRLEFEAREPHEPVEDIVYRIFRRRRGHYGCCPLVSERSLCTVASGIGSDIDSFIQSTDDCLTLRIPLPQL